MDADSRALIDATLAHTLSTQRPEEIPAALIELGFREVAEDDPEAWAALFEAQGRAIVASPSLDLVVLEGIADPVNTAVVYPAFAAGAYPAATVEGGRVHVEGMALAGAARAITFVVGASGVETGTEMLELPVDRLEQRPIAGFDPDLGLVAVRGTVDLTAAAALDRRWEAAVAPARCALAQELAGVTDALLAIAVQHVTGREQFGAPIGSFQAVKHRLADVYIASTAAKAALEVAWSDHARRTAALAKALAGRAAEVASANCHQVCGAMAFTWEFGLHRLVRRGRVLDALLGSSEALRREIGEHVARSRRVERYGRLRSPQPA